MTTPIIPNTGLDEYAETILADISHVALGTNAYSDLSVSSIRLGAEIARFAPSEKLRVGGRMTINTFFGQNSLSGTITEGAIIKDGSGETNSGKVLLFFPVSFDATSGDLSVSVVMEITR